MACACDTFGLLAPLKGLGGTGFSKVGKRQMRRTISMGIGTVWVAGAVLFSSGAGAQQKNQAPVVQGTQTYNVSREAALQGTVVKYTPASNTPPFGARVTVQTGSGVVDVHLGSAGLLAANHVSLSAGDTVRVIGENVAFGSGAQFVARVIQKGGQTVALRSIRGIPLMGGATDANGKPVKSQGGVL